MKVKDIHELKKLFSMLEGESAEVQIKINEINEMLNDSNEIPVSIDFYLDGITLKNVLDCPVDDVYNEYVTWCKLNYFESQIQSKRVFSKFLRERFYIESTTKWVNGYSKKCYVMRKEL